MTRSSGTSDAESAYAKWARLGSQWRLAFPIDNRFPDRGSWLDTRLIKGAWTLGCKVCAAAGNVGNFPAYKVCTVSALQVANFKKHAAAPHHKSAALEYLTKDTGSDPGLSPSSASALGYNIAPLAEEFRSLVAAIRKGEATCTSRKHAKMTWCITEAIKIMDQRHLARAASITLFRDERNGRLALRFRSVTQDLDVRSGTAGVARDFGTGARNITMATLAMMKRLCSSFQAAPYCTVEPTLRQSLLDHVRNTVHVMTLDAAADEVLSAEMMRCPALLNDDAQREITPCLQFVLRDKAHASRRSAAQANG